MHNVNVLVSVLFSVAINQKVGKCFHFDYNFDYLSVYGLLFIFAIFSR